METIVCLVPNDEHVATARQDLMMTGIPENEITVLLQPASVWQRLKGPLKIRRVFRYAAIGALFGLAIGALYGVPAGYLNCTLMNCPIKTSVILGVLITLFWILGGGLVGAIVGLDRLEHDLYSYVEGVRRGEALFVVEAPEERAQEAVQILRQERGTVIHEIREEMEAK